MVDTVQVTVVPMQQVSSATALRALPVPTAPPPGTLEAVIGMLLAREAPAPPLLETRS